MTNHMCLPFWRFGKDFGCKGFGFEVVAFRSFIGFTERRAGGSASTVGGLGEDLNLEPCRCSRTW